MIDRCLLMLVGLLLACVARSEGLNATNLAVLFNVADASSRLVALDYATQRAIPAENVIGIRLPNIDVVAPEIFTPIRQEALERLPVSVQSLLLVWSRPYAVGCMSMTTAFAAGYRAAFCVPGCSRTLPNPLFNTDGWLPADTVGWWPAMLLPSDDIVFARALIRRGMSANADAHPGILYLIRTSDSNRNVRAENYARAQILLASRLRIEQLTTPIASEVADVIGYFTGVANVEELERIHFLPGAIADHLTSTGGVLDGRIQMSALAWLKQGATASYGSVSEPCSYLEKFPDPTVLFEHYTNGETILESYWKSVAMPGQGIFIGEPLSRPYATRRRSYP